MLSLLSILLLLPMTTLAAEVDCPLADPERPEMRLLGAYQDFGGVEGGDSDRFIKHGDRWHHTELLEKWGDRDGELVCQYLGRELRLPVPGLMIRCDWLGRAVLRPKPVEPGTGGPTETIFLRIWCTSRP